MVDEATKELKTFAEGCVKINLEFHKRMGYSRLEEFSVSFGRRYVRIIRGTTAHCFVDRENGDVLKAASWKTPAKGVRGNIFDEFNGLKFMKGFGTVYLK